MYPKYSIALTLCKLGIFMLLLSSAYFFPLFKQFFINTIKVSNSPGLGPNCFRRLCADNKGHSQQGKS